MLISIIIGIVVESRKSFPVSPMLSPSSSYLLFRLTTTSSYRDVVIRLEPIIMELERSENILIVTHQAILRCIYAYFMKEDQQKSPWMNVPLHTLIKLTPRAYNTEIEVFKSGVEAVSTWRGKGSDALHEDPTQDTVTLGAGKKEAEEIAHPNKAKHLGVTVKTAEVEEGMAKVDIKGNVKVEHSAAAETHS